MSQSLLIFQLYLFDIIVHILLHFFSHKIVTSHPNRIELKLIDNKLDRMNLSKMFVWVKSMCYAGSFLVFKESLVHSCHADFIDKI